MVKLRDVVIVKTEKGDALADARQYERVYLAFGPNDPVAEREVTVGGKVLRITSDGKFTLDQTVGTAFQKQEPKDAVSVHTPADLMQAATAWLQTEKPKTDPFIVLLGTSEYGLDLNARAAIRNAIAPSKPIDQDKAIEQAAKKLVALGIAPDLASASAMIRAMKDKAAAQ